MHWPPNSSKLLAWYRLTISTLLAVTFCSFSAFAQTVDEPSDDGGTLDTVEIHDRLKAQFDVKGTCWDPAVIRQTTDKYKRLLQVARIDRQQQQLVEMHLKEFDQRQLEMHIALNRARHDGTELPNVDGPRLAAFAALRRDLLPRQWRLFRKIIPDKDFDFWAQCIIAPSLDEAVWRMMEGKRSLWKDKVW